MTFSTLVLAMILADPVAQPNQDVGNALDLISLGALISGGAKAESLLGDLADSSVRRERVVSSNVVMARRMQEIHDKLLVAPNVKRDGLKYRFTLLADSQVNAFALPGGYTYLNEGLARLPGVKPGEIASVLGHELGHTNAGHGTSRMKDALIAQVLLRTLAKDEAVRLVGTIAVGVITSKNSRANEFAADRLGFEYAVKAGYDPAAPLAFMRRLQTFDTRRKGEFGELFATHPRGEDRAERLKDMLFLHEYGSTFAKAASAKEIAEGVFGPYIERRWVKEFEKTGNKVYHLRNRITDLNYQGECTSFVLAVREDGDVIPARDAHFWFEDARVAKYAVGPTPKVGSIAVWSKKGVRPRLLGFIRRVTKRAGCGSDFWAHSLG